MNADAETRLLPAYAGVIRCITPGTFSAVRQRE